MSLRRCAIKSSVFQWSNKLVRGFPAKAIKIIWQSKLLMCNFKVNCPDYRVSDFNALNRTENVCEIFLKSFPLLTAMFFSSGLFFLDEWSKKKTKDSHSLFFVCRYYNYYYTELNKRNDDISRWEKRVTKGLSQGEKYPDGKMMVARVQAVNAYGPSDLSEEYVFPTTPGG